MALSLSLSVTKSTYLNLTTPSSSSRILLLLLLFPLRSFSSSPPTSNTDLDDQLSNDPLVRILEEAIHKINVRRSAPDWLPFFPGSSYWVPPLRSSYSFRGALPIAHILEKLALAHPSPARFSFSSSSRGWPSPDYFIQGASLKQIEMKVPSEEVEVETPFSNASKSEEEEG